MWARIQPKHRTADIKKSADGAVLRKLRSFLDAAEPELVYWLTTLHAEQGKAITYKELLVDIMCVVL